MTLKALTKLSAAVLMAVSPAVAQSNAAQSPSLSARSGAELSGESELDSMGPGTYIIGAIVLGLIIWGIIEVLDNGNDEPASP